MDSQDEGFYQAFRENLRIARVPFPDNPIITIGSVMAAIKEIGEGLKIAGDKPIGLLFQEFRTAIPVSVGAAGGAVALGAAAVEITTVGAALAGSFYVGVITGLALEAVIEVYGIGPAVAFGHKVKATVNSFYGSLEQFVMMGFQNHPAASCFRPRVLSVVKMVDAAPRNTQIRPRDQGMSQLERRH